VTLSAEGRAALRDAVEESTQSGVRTDEIDLDAWIDDGGRLRFIANHRSNHRRWAMIHRRSSEDEQQ